MSFVFSSAKESSPQELVRAFVSHVQEANCHPEGPEREKSLEKAQAALNTILFVVHGDNEHEPDAAEGRRVCDAVLQSRFVSLLVDNLGQLSFETRKSAGYVFSFVMTHRGQGAATGADYVIAHPEVVSTLVKACELPDVALTAGPMLRECLKHEAVAKGLLESDDLMTFFRLVELPNFDVAADAFVTLRDLFTRHKVMCGAFLEANYDRVFAAYHQLLTSGNYVARRQSLKLLGELLLDRNNYGVMARYIGDAENLKLMMNLLRDESRPIQFEAFQVFKVFVANPNKPTPIVLILKHNQDKLVKYLRTFHEDRDDEQFREEKTFVIHEVAGLGD